MKKNIEDMKIEKGRITMITRKDIAASSSRETITRPEMKKEPVVTTIIDQTPKQTSTPRGSRISSGPRVRRAGGSRKFYVALVIIACLGAAYWTMTLLEHAKVVIHAKHQMFTLEHQALAASQSDTAPIGFEIMIVSDTQYKDMTLTESATVSNKAKGEITLFNEYSTKAQTLVINTRVADKDGKMYMTDKAVSIPGYKLDAAKKIVPGQVSVTVTAFLSGSSYNSTSTDFSIVGYKNTDKASKIYGKAKTVLSGGAEGLIYTLTPDNKGAVEAQANGAFKDSLLKKVTAQVPAGYVLYDTALQFSYHTDENFNSPTAQAKVPIDGTVSAVILRKSDVAQALIKNLIPESSEKERLEIQLPDMEQLSFGFANAGQVIDKDMQSVSFTLSGTLHADWNPDIEALRSSLAGIPYSSASSIFATDPGIADATARIFPPWKRSIPADLSKIDIRLE